MKKHLRKLVLLNEKVLIIIDNTCYVPTNHAISSVVFLAEYRKLRNIIC